MAKIGLSNHSDTINALDNNGSCVINTIILEGNNITKDNIILRELTFKEKDIINKSEIQHQIQKSKENLLNTSLFNFVTIESVFLDSLTIDIYIILEERWYIWPNPIFEHADRNFSRFIANKNWDKINYGMAVIYNNFRGRKETLKFTTRFGYKEQFAMYYSKPNLDKEQKHGITFDFSYFRKHESDIQTTNNDVIYFEFEKNYLWKLLGSRITYSYRPLHYNHYKTSFQYTYIQVHDTIVKLNPNYLGNRKSKQALLGISGQFVQDKRDSKAYPLKGYYLDIVIKQDGFKILNDFSNTYVQTVSSYFGKISENFYYSTGLKWKLSSNKKLPYYKKNCLGYSDFLHGFEYYVVDGSDYILSKNNLKYQLLAPRIETLKYIPFKKFNKIHYAIYLNLFFDMGYVYDKYPPLNNNTMVNKFLYSTSIGLDYVTYYDQTLRFEYSLNQFGEHGFFFHFGAPILDRN